MFVKKIFKYIFSFLSIFSLFVSTIVVSRGGVLSSIHHDLLVITKGVVGDVSFLGTGALETELRGDIAILSGNRSGAIDFYKSAFFSLPISRIQEKIYILEQENITKDTEKNASGSENTEIQEAKKRIETNELYRNDYIQNGTQWKDTKTLFDSSISEDIDW